MLETGKTTLLYALSDEIVSRAKYNVPMDREVVLYYSSGAPGGDVRGGVAKPSRRYKLIFLPIYGLR